MMDVKEKVLQVMRSRAALQDKALGGEYPFRMATWNLRLAMEKEFPDEEWRSADLRKILMELAVVLISGSLPRKWLRLAGKYFHCIHLPSCSEGFRVMLLYLL